jgi:GAF domain-containing protein
MHRENGPALSTEVALAIAAASRSINQPVTLRDTLTRIVETARTSVPGFDHVGLSTIDRSGKVQTQVATGDLVWELDRLQYGLSEGPCVDTLHEAEVVLAPRIRLEERWPRYVPEAIRLGLKAQLAVKLYLDEQGTLGGLNLYSTSQEDIEPDAEGMADLFAAHAAIALGHVSERENLNKALQSRKVIGQAIGILMERHRMSEDRAFSFLVRASSHGNIKLSMVAQQLVDEGNRSG